jgi:hypothetical protein
LKVAKQDAFDSILALTQACAVSYDANADETRFLVDPGRAAEYQDAFLRKSLDLVNVGNVGIFSYDAALAADIRAYQADHADVRFGGYLGTEFRNITFPGERAAATRALLAYQVYEKYDRKLRAMAKTNLAQAIAFDIGTSPGQSDWAFNQWDGALGSVITIKETLSPAATRRWPRTSSVDRADPRCGHGADRGPRDRRNAPAAGRIPLKKKLRGRYEAVARTSHTAAPRCTPSASAYVASVERSDATARSAVPASAPASIVRAIDPVRKNPTASSRLPPPPTRIDTCSEVISMSRHPAAAMIWPTRSESANANMPGPSPGTGTAGGGTCSDRAARGTSSH